MLTQRAATCFDVYAFHIFRQNRALIALNKENMQKRINEILASFGKRLIDLEIHEVAAEITYASISDESSSSKLIDYNQTIYFQENEKCGYYSSYGFGCNLREYVTGRMETLMSAMERQIFDILPSGLSELVFEERFAQNNII